MEEYAIIFFRSVCLSVTHVLYIMLIMENVYSHGVKKFVAYGNSNKSRRIKPYPPSFSSIPASKTDPATGASTCASGNQICIGIIGIFMANPRKKANHNQICSVCENSQPKRVTYSKSRQPSSIEI